MDKESLTANNKRKSPHQRNEFAIKKKICNIHPSSAINLGGIIASNFAQCGLLLKIIFALKQMETAI
jgi:hypothetical protein